MPDVNFNSLHDKAMDVDPDIRFMVLQDFQKYLAVPDKRSNHNVESFLPVLFKLLNDHNTDVQSQAIKSFAPLVGQISPDSLLTVIKKLFKQVLQNEKLDNFTTSIPNVALKSIFNNNESFDLKFQRSLCNELLPELPDFESIDILEILIDLLKNFGNVLTKKELSDISTSLVNIAFNSSGIISKYAITGIEYLCNHLYDVNALVEDIFKYHKEQAIQLRLYSIIFRSDSIISDSNKEEIFYQVSSILNYDDETLIDDLDFDKILAANSLKEFALTMLIDLTATGQNKDSFESDIHEFINKYLTYNPFSNANFDESFDDDIEFSDDEDNDESQNDGSWKLRLKSSELLSKFIDAFPEAPFLTFIDDLPIDDSNEFVSEQAIIAAIQIIHKCPSHFTSLKERIVGNLLVESKSSLLPKFLKLIEALKDADLIDVTFSKFKQWKTQTSSSIDYFNFYENILELQLSPQVTSYICRDLESSLADKSFNVIKQSIKVLTILARSSNEIENINGLIDLLVNMINNSKLYSSDLLQSCIVCLSELVLKDLSKQNIILESFKSSLQVDSCNKVIIENLIKLLPFVELEDNHGQFFIEKATSLITANDDITNSLAVNVLFLTLKNHQPSNGEEVVTKVLKILNQEKPITYEFNILESIAKDSAQDAVISTLVKLINNAKLELDESLYSLVGTLSVSNSDLFDRFLKELDLKLFLSAKVLAIIAIENQLKNEIDSRQEKLTIQLKDKSSIGTVDFLFNIQFLANVSESINLDIVESAELLTFLDEKESSEEADNVDVSILNKSVDITNEGIVKTAIAKFIGIIIKQNIHQLPQALNHYQQSQNKSRVYLVTSFKEIIKTCEESKSKQIWDAIISTIQTLEFNHERSLELRLTGDLLSEICYDNDALIQNLLQLIVSTNLEAHSAIYAYIITIRGLIGKSEDEDVIDLLISESVKFVTIVDIDIRQALIGTWISSLHANLIMLKHLNDILPNLFEQLIAEQSFKKIIKMGPYKFVQDNGIEIRKLIHELFYLIVSLNEELTEQHQIDIIGIITSIIEKGLLDDQIDIVVLSCDNLLFILKNFEHIFYDVIVKDNLIDTLSNNLTLQLNKKLSVKASSQDTDSFNERVASILKLAKRVESKFGFSEKEKFETEEDGVNVELELDNWRTFYQFLKSDHTRKLNEISV